MGVGLQRSWAVERDDLDDFPRPVDTARSGERTAASSLLSLSAGLGARVDAHDEEGHPLPLWGTSPVSGQSEGVISR